MNKFFIWLILFFLGTGIGCWLPSSAPASPVDLDRIPETTPLLAVPKNRFSGLLNRFGIKGMPMALALPDEGEGLEYFSSKDSYIQGQIIYPTSQIQLWQQNLQAEFFSPQPDHAAFSISGPLDLGKDRPLLVVTGTNTDCSLWRFWLVDPETGDVVSQFDRSGGQDLNRDRIWDGSYIVLGSMPVPTPEGTRMALILVRKVGFDLDGRSVLAVDPTTGRSFWEYTTGAQFTPPQSALRDLDQDGTPEIILTSTSPCNLAGRKINGFGDDRPYLIVLGSDGTPVWHRQLMTIPGSVNLSTGDLDADGQLEVITVSHGIYESQSILAVWDPEGKPLATLQRNSLLNQNQLLAVDQEGHLDIFTDEVSTHLYRFGLENGHLVQKGEAQATQEARLLAKVPLPNSSSYGLVVHDKNGLGKILDKDFHILATYQDNNFSRRILTPPPGSPPAFFLIGSPLGQITLMPNPQATAWNRFRHSLSHPRSFLIVGLALGLILSLLIWRLVLARSLPAAGPVPATPSDPLSLKERRLHLLEDLEISNHGAMAPLRSLRRLLWMLDAVQSGVGVNPNLLARMKEIWQDCHDDALPRLTNILERARLARSSEPLVNESLSSLGRINAILTELSRHGFQSETVEEHLFSLHKEDQTAEKLLQNLRREVSSFFRAPLKVVVTKVLRANQTQLEANSVKVQIGMAAEAAAGGDSQTQSGEDIVCRMDPGELGFILDNLVDNACRAMSTSTQPRLHITWRQVNGMVHLEVSDSGIGIPLEDQQKVLEAGYSQRPGGGLGLPKSQRLLRKYGGHISIKQSAPGRGTTFALVVPRA